MDAAIEAAGKLNKDDYTTESWDALQKVLEEVSKATLDSQAAIDMAEAAVNAAIDSLVKKPEEILIDKSNLDAAIEAAGKLNKDDYTTESWDALQKVLEEVSKATLDTQAAVDMAEAAIKAAVDSLVKKQAPALDYTELNTVIGLASGLKQADYTADTWSAMKAALTAAQALVNAADSQAQIDDATAALVAAVKALKKVVAVVEPPVTTKPIWYVLMWVSVAINAIAAVIVVVYFILKKKKVKDNVPMVDYAAEDDENSDSNE